MTKTRYGFSFIISAVIYALLAISIVSVAHVPKVLKKPEEQSIKVSIITPVVKKAITPIKVPTPAITPPKKVKPKKVIKKKSIKKVKKTTKKKTKPKKVIKKVKPKKIVKKKILKKSQPKKIIKEVKPQPIIETEPIYTSSIVPDEIYTHSSIVDDTPPVVYSEPKIEYQQPIVTAPPVVYTPEPVQIQEAQPVAPTVTQVHDNSAIKKAFLRDLRGKIIANKEYPQLAKRRHIQGSVEVRFDLTATGDVSNIRFLSGKSILQKGVRKAILRSFPLNIPFEIQNELPMYNISVTVNFNIRQ